MKKENKILVGIALMILGAFGAVFGRSIRQVFVRGFVVFSSVVTFGTGFYIFVDGVDDRAVGVVGRYAVETDSGAQPIEYATKEDFERGIKLAFKAQPDLRRLHFACPDKSETFTVYKTPVGLVGMPATDITCADGFKLVNILRES